MRSLDRLNKESKFSPFRRTAPFRAGRSRTTRRPKVPADRLSPASAQSASWSAGDGLCRQRSGLGRSARVSGLRLRNIDPPMGFWRRRSPPMCRREAAAATIQRRLVIQIPTKPLRASWSLVGPKENLAANSSEMAAGNPLLLQTFRSASIGDITKNSCFDA